MGGKKIKELQWFSFVCPALLLFIIFYIIPAFRAIRYSFTKWDGVTSEYIGLKNYVDLFHDADILASFSNTVLYTFSIVILQNIVGLMLAILFNKKCRRNNFLRTLFFMPYVFSTLIIGFIFKFILEPKGPLNSILRLMNLDTLIRPWLSNPAYAKWVIIFVTVWQCAGLTMVLNIAGLQSISQDYYEAAVIDGASKWKQFTDITLPLLAPVTTVTVVTSLINNLQLFDQIFAITSGGPGYTTESMAVTIYRLGFGTGGATWGYGAAMSVVMFIVLIIVTFGCTSFLRRREVDI